MSARPRPGRRASVRAACRAPRRRRPAARGARCRNRHHAACDCTGALGAHAPPPASFLLFSGTTVPAIDLTLPRATVRPAGCRAHADRRSPAGSAARGGPARRRRGEGLAGKAHVAQPAAGGEPPCRALDRCAPEGRGRRPARQAELRRRDRTVDRARPDVIGLLPGRVGAGHRDHQQGGGGEGKGELYVCKAGHETSESVDGSTH